MSLRVYLPERSDYTHENSAFDILARAMHGYFAERAEPVHLIGNFRWNNAQVDAAVLSTACIVLIDFKSHTGDLILSENGQWMCGDVVVAGGSSINPYVQVEKVKKTIANTGVPYDSMHGMVVFNKVIQTNELPFDCGKWFGIADLTNAARLIDQRRAKIQLDEDRIESVIANLRVPSFTGYLDRPTPKRLDSASRREPLAIRVDSATPSQRAVLDDVREFVAAKSADVHIVTGMKRTGKTQLVTWIAEDLERRGLSAVLLDACPNADGSIYSVIFGNETLEADVKLADKEAACGKVTFLEPIGVSQQNAREKKTSHTILPLRTNIDAPGSVYLVDNAHLINSTYDDSSDVRFGSGKLLPDLLEYVSACQDAKVIFVGDPYQLMIGDLGGVPICDEAWANGRRCTKSSELDDVMVGGSACPMAALEGLRAYIKADDSLSTLDIDDPKAPNIEAGAFEAGLDDAIGSHGAERAVAIVSTHERALEVAVAYRQRRGRVGQIAPGDEIELYQRLPTGECGVIRRFLERGAVCFIEEVGEVVEVRQALQGRTTELVCSLQKVKVSSKTGSFDAREALADVWLLIEFLYDPKPRTRTDIALALRVHRGFNGNNINYVYCARFAYSITADRAQRYSRSYAVVDARFDAVSERVQKSAVDQARWLYTALSGCEDGVVLSGFRALDQYINLVVKPPVENIPLVSPELLLPERARDVAHLRDSFESLLRSRVEAAGWRVCPRASSQYREAFLVERETGRVAADAYYDNQLNHATRVRITGTDAEVVRALLLRAPESFERLGAVERTVLGSIGARLGREYQIVAAVPQQYQLVVTAVRGNQSAKLRVAYDGERRLSTAQCIQASSAAIADAVTQRLRAEKKA